MDTCTLSIGTHVYLLDADADIAGFQTRLTEIVQRGGGMIDIPTVGPDRMSALVSPGLSIVFHVHRTPEPDRDPSAQDSGSWRAGNLDDLDWDFI